MIHVEFIDFDAKIHDMLGLVQGTVPLTEFQAFQWLEAQKNPRSLLKELALIQLEVGVPSSDPYIERRLQKIHTLFESFKKPSTEFRDRLFTVFLKENPAELEFHAKFFYPEEEDRFQNIWRKIEALPCASDPTINWIDLTIRRIKNLALSKEHTYEIFSAWVKRLVEEKRPTQKDLLLLFWNSFPSPEEILENLEEEHRFELAKIGALLDPSKIITHIRAFQLTCPILRYEIASIVLKKDATALKKIEKHFDFDSVFLTALKIQICYRDLALRTGYDCHTPQKYPCLLDI